MTSVFAKSGYSYSEIDSHIQELSDLLSQAVAPDFAKLGFEMSDFRIERTDFDEKTHERIDKIADKMAEAQGDAAKVNEFANINGAGIANYATMEQLRALNAAAANQNGMAGMGVGMGLGAGLGAGMGFGGMNMMQNQMQQPQAAPQAPQVATVACKGCGAQIKATAKFCPECGKPQNQAQKCPECGAEVEGKFCPECGHKM
ncbi:MAG: zinc-ribbon domain-containing protein [Candidatus Riflebacteria bacterium]|nr:zinc-ribbon domain-containing protein [Candidatus Riflebacteria bacterium]